MKTKPYIIDDVIYIIPEKVADDISKMTCEIYDQKAVLKEMQQQYNKLLEDYKELKKENSYLVQIINRLEGGCDDGLQG